MAVIHREISIRIVDLGALDGAEINHFEVDGGTLFIAGGFEFEGHRILVPEYPRGIKVPQKDQEVAR